MASITLIELHLDGDTQFGPSGFGTSGESPVEDGAETDEEDGGGKPIGVVVGLLALVAIAVAIKKFRGGDEEIDEFETADEPDVVVD